MESEVKAGFYYRCGSSKDGGYQFGFVDSKEEAEQKIKEYQQEKQQEELAREQQLKEMEIFDAKIEQYEYQLKDFLKHVFLSEDEDEKRAWSIALDNIGWSLYDQGGQS